MTATPSDPPFTLGVGRPRWFSENLVLANEKARIYASASTSISTATMTGADAVPTNRNAPP
jgi:hypothetical protein